MDVVALLLNDKTFITSVSKVRGILLGQHLSDVLLEKTKPKTTEGRRFQIILQLFNAILFMQQMSSDRISLWCATGTSGILVNSHLAA